MRILKRGLKITGKIAMGFVLFIVLYLITAFILSRITVPAETPAKDEVAIYIITNGLHTDIAVPALTTLIDWRKQLKPKHATSVDSTHQYIAMGWGDKGFFLQTPTWADLKASVAFKAATGLSSTAMHTTYYKDMEENESCKKIFISTEQYARLILYIDKSFQKDANGRFIHIKTDANYGITDAFYEATGNYSMARTCNSWANSALKASGQKACLWTAFDTGIFHKYKD